MGTDESSKFTELSTYFKTKGVDDPELIQVLSPNMVLVYDETIDAGDPSGTIEDIYIYKDGKLTDKSVKLLNVTFNVKEAILRKDWDTIANLGELIPAASSVVEKLHKSTEPTIGATILATVGILLFIGKVRKLSQIKLTADEAILLTELYRLNAEENTVKRDDVPMILHKQLNNEQIEKALLNLDRLGCIKLSMDEIILVEKIIIQ